MDIPGVDKDKGPTDTPKKKKHREQIIVVGTLVLVLLTFMMVARRGSSAPAGQPATGAGDPTADGVGGVAGGGGGSDMYAWLPAAMAGLPGQVAALTQTAQSRILAGQRADRKRDNRILANQRRIEHELLAMRHPHRPKHPITVHHKHAPHKHHPAHHAVPLPRRVPAPRRSSPFPKPGTHPRTY